VSLRSLFDLSADRFQVIPLSSSYLRTTTNLLQAEKVIAVLGIAGANEL
jgi:hypothetical protein